MQVVHNPIIKSKNYNHCHKDSQRLTQMLMLKSKTSRSIIATEEKCTQFNWCFQYMVIMNQDATFYLKDIGNKK